MCADVTKGRSVRIFISKKIRFYKAVQNFPQNNFFVNLLINIVYYLYIYLYLHIYIPNQAICVAKIFVIVECKTLRSIYSITLDFHNACFE